MNKKSEDQKQARQVSNKIGVLFIDYKNDSKTFSQFIGTLIFWSLIQVSKSMVKLEIFKLNCILNYRKRQQCASPNATFVFPIYVQKWNSKQMGFKSLFLHPWDLWKSCVKYHLAARLAAFPTIHRLSSKFLPSSLNESY